MSKYSHFEMCEKIFGQKYKWNEQKHDYEPYSRTDMWNKMIEQQDKISDLEAKLAEKEKERELDNSFWKQECDSLQKTLVEKEKEIDNLYNRLNSKQKFYEMSLEKDYKEYLSRLDKLEKQCDKDKISFTLEQLEKVKETTECVLDNALKNSSLNQSYYDRLLDEIDNQIKQLKEKE